MATPGKQPAASGAPFCGLPCAAPAASWTAGKALGQYSIGGVGVYVQKSSAPLSAHILNFVELYFGAHYYAQDQFNSDYSSAMGYITLPSFQSKGRRIPCLSFNVLTNTGAVDFGVENVGQGWFPFFWAGYVRKSYADKEFGNPDSSKYPYLNTHPDAVKVLISMDAFVQGGNDVVRTFYRFLNARGASVGDHTLKFSVPQGQLFSEYSNGWPKLRFGRFMSWLPTVPTYKGEPFGLKRWDADKADMSSMTGATFTSLQLYERAYRVYRPWDQSRLEHVWWVETANTPMVQVSQSGSTLSDAFNALQQFWYI